MIGRIYNFEECYKFKKYGVGTMRRIYAPKFDHEKHKKVIEMTIIEQRVEKSRLDDNKDELVNRELSKIHEDS
jgi:hypothetical protein